MLKIGLHVEIVSYIKLKYWHVLTVAGDGLAL